MRSLRFGALPRLFAAALVALAFPLAVRAAEVVSASVTPGVTILGQTTLAGGASTSSNVRLPNAYAPINFSNGTLAGQVSVKWFDSRTYASSTPVTLDLTTLAGAATNTGSAAFAKVKVFAIYNNEVADSGKDLIIGNAAATPFAGPFGGTAPTITVKAGCSFVIYDLSTAGWACGTNKNLKIDPGANNVSASIVLAGN